MTLNNEWDLFVSHATEDKGEFVRPLADVLSQFGVRVWYDEFSLEAGDSLSRAIDKGLAKSNFGVVVLSPAFIEKPWPEYELRGLTAREVGGSKVIIPIWHKLTRQELLAYSPPLADKLALVSADKTVVQLAVDIIKIVRPDLFRRIQRKAAMALQRRTGKVERIKLSKIKHAPFRHETLPDELIGRIRLVRAALLGVHTFSMQHWIDGFRRDTNPSSEVRIWEHIAACYNEYAAMTRLSHEQYQTAFNVCLGLSIGLEQNELKKWTDELPKDAYTVITKIFQHAVPAYDVESEPFPGPEELDATAIAREDRAIFPFDVPDELIARYVDDL